MLSGFELYPRWVPLNNYSKFQSFPFLVEKCDVKSSDEAATHRRNSLASFFYVDVLIPSYLENRQTKKYGRILSSQSLFVVNLVTA